jgi:Cd2+/Zn2+-exporting ATPase
MLIQQTLFILLLQSAYGGKFVGYLTISDSIKVDAKIAVDKLRKMGVRPLC